MQSTGNNAAEWYSNNMPSDPPEDYSNPEILKIMLQSPDGASKLEAELIVYWDKLEDLLVSAGVDPDTLGYELTRHEKERLANLAAEYKISPDAYMTVRRKPGSTLQ